MIALFRRGAQRLIIPVIPRVNVRSKVNVGLGRLSLGTAAKLKHASRDRHREFYRPLQDPMLNSRRQRPSAFEAPYAAAHDIGDAREMVAHLL